MKISITGRTVITQQGQFSRGDILSAPPYHEAFLRHLVHDAGAAVEIKDAPAPDEVKKKVVDTRSIPSSGPVKASRKKTAHKRTKKQP